MSSRSSSGVFVSVLAAVTLALGCTSLTAPPSPEPINTDSAQVTAPARPAPPASAANSAPINPAAAARILDAGAAPAPDPNAKLQIDDITVGKGKEAKNGSKLTVHYVGKLQNGEEFDANRKGSGKAPFELELGKGQVIRGWDQGLVGMKVGGKRKLTIPPALGYGARGAGPKIPPNSTLVFEVELVDVK